MRVWWVRQREGHRSRRCLKELFCSPSIRTSHTIHEMPTKNKQRLIITYMKWNYRFIDVRTQKSGNLMRQSYEHASLREHYYPRAYSFFF